jgi:hypothetical protein
MFCHIFAGFFPMRGTAMRHLAVVSVALLAFCFASSPAAAERRVALVIGNSSYVYVPRLANPANDARLMSDTLRSLGFTLVGGGAQLDLDIDQFRHVMQDFGNALQEADVGLFYYAGHGIQVKGSNYLVPIGANPTREADVDLQLLDSNVVLRQMEGAGIKLSLMILDACRNNPFGGRGLRATSGGLAQMQAPEGTLISFATQPGAVAQDGIDSNSPYTKALVKAMRKPGIDVLRTFNEVGVAVASATGHAQEPWVSFSPLTGEFYFSGAPAQAAAPAVASETDTRTDYQFAERVGTKEAWDSFIASHPSGFYAELAKAARNKLASDNAKPMPEQVKTAAVEPARLAEPKPQAQVEPQVQPQAPVAVAKPAEPVVAALPPPAATEPAPPPRPLPEVIARLLQTELRRVGCKTGGSDGEWDASDRKALSLYNDRAGTKFDVKVASLDALDSVRTHADRVCPIDCDRGFHASGDHCVKITCDDDQVLGPNGTCQARPERAVKPVPRPRASAARGGGGGGRCFSFNGRQVCE